MSDEASGAVQGALPPREAPVSRSMADQRPAVRLTQVAGGQYVFTTQPSPTAMPALAQISSGALVSTNAAGGVTRIISISPSRGQLSTSSSSALRPSLTSQSIVNALTKSRSNSNGAAGGGGNVRVQLFTGDRKRAGGGEKQRDGYEGFAAKRRRVMNDRNVRSKIVKEKYMEHLVEEFQLEVGANVLDLHPIEKRPKTPQLYRYLKEKAIDPRDYVEDNVVASVPSATQASSLPGATVTSNVVSPIVAPKAIVESKSAVHKTKSLTPVSSQEQIVEKAKQEAYVVQRINELQKEGLWSERRLPKVQEMPRGKAHWDFLLEEMVWLAADFAQERKWKKAAAKKCARMVQKYFQDKASAAQRAEKAQEQHLKRIAAFCAKEIKNFWNNVEKLVEYKQNTRLEEKRKKALDQHLSFIVDQTEKYSQLLAEGMNKPTADSHPASEPPSRPHSRMSDDEFDPNNQSSTDDEETIAQAEVGEAEQKEEVEALQRESEMDFESFLSELPKDYLQNRDKIQLSASENSDEESEDDPPPSTSKPTKGDVDFEATSSSEDDEDTIQEQEQAEGDQNHAEELADLEAENEMSIEELRRKYSDLPVDDDSAMSVVDESDTSSGNDESDADMEVDSEENAEETEDVGLRALVDERVEDGEGEKTVNKNNDLINDAAAIAESIQPKGNTLSSTSVVTPVPFLLKLPLREYQHIGLDWLVTMFERKLNGILADEMGLGKTIQTIALLAHLACEKENWGPHLIIVPTSVMLNWEMECKKWCPAFKILTYYGTQKERKAKRTGWTKPNAFHICITSYKLVIQDHQSFRRKKWKYLILDEAQNIKNFKSQRWQLLLNFQTQQRLLLTGTPLQNNLMELWSLMHFLMPHVFQSHREFKEWFSNPVTGMIEGNSEYNESIIKRLHKVLRPFLLRRLKCEVEKQMPKKYEHIVMCRLSKRQRFLYDDYMSRAKTKETLASGNLLSVINVLMQLRKVCNHPNLFEVRPTISPFQCEGITQHVPSIIYNALAYNVWKHIDLCSVNLNLAQLEFRLTAYQSYRMAQYKAPKQLIMEIDDKFDQPPCCPPTKLSLRVIKGCDDTKIETDSTTKTVPNFKLKIPPNYGLQLVSQTIGIPVVSVSQSASSAMQPPATVPVLKSSDKLSTTGFAQLVQTSTGKHILLTSNPSIPANMGSVSPTGQKLTFLSKQPVATGSNVPQQITKAYVKFQLTSVPGISQTTAATVPSVQNTVDQEREQEPHDPRKTVGTRFISKLYSKSNNLDVRWKDEKNSDPEDDEFNFEQRRSRLALMAELNERRCAVTPIYGKDFHDSVKIFQPSRTHAIWSAGRNHCLNTLFKIDPHHTSDCLRDMMYTPERRIEQLKDVCDRFVVYVPAVRAPEPEMRAWHPDPSAYWLEKRETERLSSFLSRFATPLHRIASAMVTQFPDPRLIQCDCGKLQTLDRLLRRLKAEGHRVLIFTQMTKMLDVLEAFLNYHGHIYLRLDGSTKVDQRQVLMERFNGDTRIFAFILSTRSGGIGVNLTGADTVIFYDSDWNPTMDAQAQDRCHRIGQTRDVNIYRLVSERTIEENILKKANQKRLLGDLAIEGGNFTTAYFKSSTIQDLFDIDNTDESAANRMSEVLDINKAREQQRVGGNAPDQSTSTSPVPPTGGGGDDRAAMGALENALAACEDDQDVIAARTAKAEAVADLAEFDENIPLEEHDKDKEPDISRAEQEVENLIKQLTPVERYAMRFIEETDAAWSAEQLAAAEREIEEQKREWEQNRLAAIKEEQERRARELEEESEVLTYSREDATNQIWVSVNTMEQMPMWCPPTPPQQDTDIYIDHTLSFLYETQTIPESQLPPVYVKKDAKRSRHDAGFQESRRALKIARKDDGTGGAVYAPRSLFERPSPALVKMRRDVKLQKYRGIVRPPVPLPGMKMALSKSSIDPPCWHNWSIHEDMALLKVIQTYQGLPLNLMIVSPGHTPNWDFVADYVNTVSITYRSPKQCRHRYETVLIPREEGKQLFDSPTRKKKNKSGSLHKFPMQQKSSRTMRTSQLYLQDNNSTFSQLALQRYDILKSLPTKKSMSTKSVITNPLVKNPKHTALLNECGIDMEKAVLPSDVASKRSEREKAERERAERAAKEKKGLLTPEMQLAMAQRLHRMSSGSSSSASSQQATSSATSTVASPVVVTSSIVVTSTAPTSVAAAVIASPSTPPGGANAALRTQRIIASPLQTQTVVSVSGLSPAQLQAATQRLIVSAGAGGQAKAAVVGGTTTVGGKAFSQAQLQIIRQQLRLQAAGGLTAQTVKTTIGGQTAVQVQFTQTQPRTQFVRQGPVAVTNKQGITRTVTEGEMVQILKNKQQQQQQQQQQKVVVTGAQANTMQTLTPQVFAQAIQQAGSSGTQVATLVKAGAQTVSIPVTGVTIGTPVVKTAGGMIKTGQQQPVRNLQQFQQQLLAQKKLVNQKIAGIAQVAGKSGVATQVIVGSKPLSTAMTMQQFQQVIRSPLTIPQGPVVLAKGPSRVIPVNTGQGTKQTIQVVAATSQGITTTIRPQVSSSLAGALASIKVQGAAGMGGGGGGSQTAQQTLLSQVSAALQNQNVVRQGSPVRIQTASGTPIVAVTVQQQQNVATQQQQHAAGDRQEQPQQVSRFLKK